MMRDICARFKYSERDPAAVAPRVVAATGSSPASPTASTPRSTMTDRERSNSELSVDGSVASDDGGLCTPTGDTKQPTQTPTPTAHSASPPRELIHRNLRRYHRELEAGSVDLAAVGERILEDLAPYSVLKLGGFSLGNVAPKLLATVLTRTSNLRTLDLGFNRINDRGATLLAKALEQNQSLERLYLSGNDIGPVGATAIATALATNTTLVSLHLSGNNIGEEGTRQLAEGLKLNTNLRSLYIGTNGIGGNGMKCLADALQVNQHLEELTLGQNKIGSLGLKHLAAAFATGHVKLTMLEIGKNNIDAEGVIALAKALCNPSNRLQNLYMDNNPIGDVGAGAFGALLAKNAILRVLDLSYTQMSLLGLRDLSMGLAYSSSLLCLLLDGHDWASTQYMKKNNALNGMSLSAKGANNFAATCIVGAINSNVKSVLYKLTGVDLTLILSTLPLTPGERDALVGDLNDGLRRPMDLVSRNERVLKYLQDQRNAVNVLKRKSSDVPSDDGHKEEAAAKREESESTDIVEPQAQRRKTAVSESAYQSLTVDTTVSARPPLRQSQVFTPSAVMGSSARPPIPTSTRPPLVRGPIPRHPSWSSSDRKLSIKSPRYESTMEVQVRKVITEIASMPFNADEYDALQTYYLGGCQGPKTATKLTNGIVPQESPSSSADTLPEKVAEQVPCPACRSSRLAQYPQTMILKARLETKPESEKLLLVLLRQLHYLVGVFQHIDNAELKIDAILVSVHDPVV